MSSTAKKLPTPIPVVGRPLAFNWRVLIVEDEPAIAEAIKSIIVPSSNVIPINRSSRQKPIAASLNPDPNPPEHRKDKFEVVWAKNPTEALELVRNSVADDMPFAMGFFDVLLGSEIDGIELVRQIQAIDAKMFAVFVTAYHDRTVDSINQILGQSKSDRWDYMNKPFTDGSILQKARNSVSMWNLKEEKRLQEDQLAEAANLLLQGERTNAVAAVGRSVAHEFGNLLMHIIGHAELAIMKNDETQMKQTLMTILKAGDTASAVLKKFKKLNHNDTEADVQMMNMNQCLDEAIDLMTHEFKKKNIHINRVQSENISLRANYHSLVQVFINLFINANYAMATTGQIDISVQKSSVVHDDPSFYWVEIHIRDNGPGIPEEILPRVMDAFYTTKGKQGTGLGLAICKEIIENEHQGEFAIANHPEKGLEITIKLPTKIEVEDV